MIQGVNFSNVLRGAFFVRKSFRQLFGSFSLATFGFVIFGAKILLQKRRCKTLMKSTQGLIFSLGRLKMTCAIKPLNDVYFRTRFVVCDLNSSNRINSKCKIFTMITIQIIRDTFLTSSLSV